MYSCSTQRKMPRAVAALLLCLLVLAISACEWTDLVDGDDDDDDDSNSDNTPPATETRVPGLSVAVSSSDFETTSDTLIDTLNASANFVALARVDHQANADSSSSLRPTTVVLFDDANRSSPLILADPRVALDLPARVLVYRDSENDIGVAYTNGDYLDARYDLDEAEDGALDGFDADIETLVNDVAGDDPSSGAASGVSEAEGIESVESSQNFNSTLNALIAAVDSRSALTRLDPIDFQARSTRNGVTPNTLVIFGNPDVGTPLIRASQTIGVDLPQKVLVSQADDGTVMIYYNDPGFIADRHDITGRDDEIDAIGDLLADLADEAAGNSNTSTAASTNAGTGSMSTMGTATTGQSGGSSTTP